MNCELQYCVSMAIATTQTNSSERIKPHVEGTQFLLKFVGRGGLWCMCPIYHRYCIFFFRKRCSCTRA